MAFLETPRFPVDLNYGTMGGPMFSTDVVVYGNGKEYRNKNWSIPKRAYDIRYINKTRINFLNIYEFFLSVGGMFDGFRIKDLWDWTSASDGKSTPAADDQSLGTGDGSTTEFQLKKKWVKGANSLTKNIRKPVTSTVVIEVDGVSQTESVDFTVDTTTGIVTFTTAPSNGDVITCGFEYDIPVRFDSDDMTSILQSVYTAAGGDIVGIDAIPLIEDFNE